MTKIIKIKYDDKQKDIPIKEFQVKNMMRNSVIYIIDNKETNKILLVEKILTMLNLSGGIIISPINKLNDNYNSLTYHEYNEEIIENLFERQRYALGKSKNKKDARAFLFLDDCLTSERLKNRNIQEIFMNGRISGLTVIITSKNILRLPPLLRTNIDHIFLFAADSQSEKKILFEQFSPIFDKKIFYQIFEQLTKNNGCMVINNGGNRINIWDKINYYEI